MKRFIDRPTHAALSAALLGWVLLSTPLAQAQFAGDIFFERPSIAVASGESGTLVAQAFAGDLPLGALKLEVTYPADRLRIGPIDAGSSFAADGEFVIIDEPGRLQIALANGRELDLPIGTVTLFELTVEPLSAAGDVVPLSLTLERYLNTDATERVGGTGFDAEVAVIASGSAPNTTGNPGSGQQSAPLQVDVGDPGFDRASTLRPPGSVVTLEVPSDGGSDRVAVRLPPVDGAVTD